VPPLLEVRELTIQFPQSRGTGQQRSAAAAPVPLVAVRQLSFSIAAGEVLGLVGESGSGKSVTSLEFWDCFPPQPSSPAKSLFKMAPRTATGPRNSQHSGPINFSRFAGRE